MYSAPQIVLKYLSYYINSKNGRGHGTHSPFVFDFITKILNDRTDYPEYEKVEELRKKLFADKTKLKIDDLGAGSSSPSSRRTVASIAKNAAKPKKYAQLLFRIVKYYQPETIIELGTSLGITTCYLSLANPEARIFTLEGADAVAKLAWQNFRDSGLENINLIKGNFDNTLPAVLYQVPKIDFVFIDGNHRKEPTENYFRWLLSKVHNNTILVFDDIHWSREMEEAWENIRSHLVVRCSIDLFFFGIIFFRQEFKERQHFKIRW